MKSTGKLATAHTSATPKKKKKKKKVDQRQDLRILPILNVAMLPVNITDEHCTEFICVIDVAETEIHSTSLDFISTGGYPDNY